MVPRWKVTRAVRRSSLTSTQRLLVYVLADIADADTSIIPPERERSLTQLAKDSGLGRSTVAEALNKIEQMGWVVRERPSVAAAWGEKARTQYRLTIPVNLPPETTSPGAGLVQELDQSTSPGAGLSEATSPGAGPRLVQELDTNYPTNPPTSKSSSSSPATTSPGDEQKTSEPKKRKRRTTAELNADRPDVDALCNRLADRMVTNGCKRPTISDEWRTDARLLLDRDGRELDKALALIDWCQADSFWRSNIQSMPTFRAKYDGLRLKALAAWEAERKPAPARANGHKPYQNSDDPNYYVDED